METAERARVIRWGRLAALSALSTLALIVLGGVVRITGSGMGCGDDWPLCNGSLLPPLDFATMIEYGHRLAASVVALLVFGLLALALWYGRADARGWKSLRQYSGMAAVLLVVQIGLGAVTVWLELPPASVILHLGTAMLLLATLIGATLAALSRRPGRARDRAARLGLVTAVFGLAVVLAGALVANLDAASACQGFPLCNGELLPAANPLVRVHWAHRALAYGLVILCVAQPWMMRRARPGDGAISRWAVAAALLAVLQVAVAADMVLRGLPDATRAVHLGLGASVFAALVGVAWFAARPIGEGSGDARAPASV